MSEDNYWKEKYHELEKKTKIQIENLRETKAWSYGLIIILIIIIVILAFNIGDTINNGLTIDTAIQMCKELRP